MGKFKKEDYDKEADKGLEEAVLYLNENTPGGYMWVVLKLSTEFTAFAVGQGPVAVKKAYAKAKKKTMQRHLLLLIIRSCQLQ